MAKAKYTIYVPSQGNAALAVRKYMESGPVATDIPRVVSGDPYDAVTAFAEDTPENDSHFKQTGTLTAEAINEPMLTVVKESKQGIQTWQMRNPHYAPVSVHDGLSQSPGTPDNEIATRP